MSANEVISKFELYRSQEEEAARADLARLFQESPIPPHELVANLGLFLTSKNLARVLVMQHLYEQIVDVQGVVLEFGTRWGQNLALFAALRGIYEPFNRHRKIVGFDTFEGFPGIGEKDAQNHDVIRPGGLALPKDYDLYLRKVLGVIERDNPASHITKFDVRKGDAPVEIGRYLQEFPETIVALAYFDLDLYAPTKACLESIRTRLVRGSVLGFDELNDHDSPGETLALLETFGLNGIRLRRYRYASRVSYFVVE